MFALVYSSMPSLYAISKNLSSTFVDIFKDPPLYPYKIRHIYTPKKKRPSGDRIYTATCKRTEKLRLHAPIYHYSRLHAPIRLFTPRITPASKRKRHGEPPTPVNIMKNERIYERMGMAILPLPRIFAALTRIFSEFSSIPVYRLVYQNGILVYRLWYTRGIPIQILRRKNEQAN